MVGGECPYGQYADEETFSCTNWTKCPINTFVQQNGTSISDAVCKKCGTGNISLLENHVSAAKELLLNINIHEIEEVNKGVSVFYGWGCSVIMQVDDNFTPSDGRR